MTVKELINKLLDCSMDAEVEVLVEIDRDTTTERLDECGSYPFPFDDQLPVEYVENLNRNCVRILLPECKKW